MNLRDVTDEELRAEARRRGFELHSTQFSQAAQHALSKSRKTTGDTTFVVPGGWGMDWDGYPRSVLPAGR
jgi:hypothetical protein